MDIWSKIILLVVILHFVAGFGFLVYKLSAPAKKKPQQTHKHD